MNIEKAKQKIEKYLQEECSDYWHVKLQGDEIMAYFIDTLRFVITYDDGDWNISGTDIDISMVYNIAIVLETNL